MAYRFKSGLRYQDYQGLTEIKAIFLNPQINLATLYLPIRKIKKAPGFPGALQYSIHYFKSPEYYFFLTLTESNFLKFMCIPIKNKRYMTNIIFLDKYSKVCEYVDMNKGAEYNPIILYVMR
jgi:hypothetical protein